MGVKERREREEHLRLEAILAAAERVFSRHGYHEARMDDIAAEAELSKGALYYYFQSKDEIFARLLELDSEKRLAEIRRRIPEGLDFTGAVERLIAFMLESAEADRGFMTMMLPSMGGFIRFGDPAIVRRAKQSLDAFGAYIRDTPGKRIRREGLLLKADDLYAFLKALHFGIGIAVLDGRTDEAKAAARFLLDLVEKAAAIAEKKSAGTGKRKNSPRSSSNYPK